MGRAAGAPANSQRSLPSGRPRRRPEAARAGGSTRRGSPRCSSSTGGPRARRSRPWGAEGGGGLGAVPERQACRGDHAPLPRNDPRDVNDPDGRVEGPRGHETSVLHGATGPSGMCPNGGGAAPGRTGEKRAVVTAAPCSTMARVVSERASRSSRERCARHGAGADGRGVSRGPGGRTHVAGSVQVQRRPVDRAGPRCADRSVGRHDGRVAAAAAGLRPHPLLLLRGHGAGTRRAWGRPTHRPPGHTSTFDASCTRASRRRLGRRDSTARAARRVGLGPAGGGRREGAGTWRHRRRGHGHRCGFKPIVTELPG